MKLKCCLALNRFLKLYQLSCLIKWGLAWRNNGVFLAVNMWGKNLNMLQVECEYIAVYILSNVFRLFRVVEVFSWVYMGISEKCT